MLITRQYASFHTMICVILSNKMRQIVWSFDVFYNAFAVQRWRRCTFDSPGLASAYPGLCVLCGGQRRRCCTFSAWNAVIKWWDIKGTTPTALLPLTANDPGLTSPSLVNPGLSKVQRLQRCIVRTFMVTDVFIGILARHLWCCVVITFIMENISIGILTHFAILLFVCWH